MRRTPLIVTALVSAVLLAACSGPAEPDRSTPTAAPAASATAALSSAPFLSTNCAKAEAPIASDQEPSNAQGIDGAFVTLDDTGVPTITISDKAPDATSLQSIDLVAGKGPQVKAGDTLTVNYCGVGLTSRVMFDSSWVRGEPASFGLDGLIQGWIDGLPGMKVGAERMLVIPGELAYGANPPAAGIGPNETLVFVVQLLSIQ